MKVMLIWKFTNLIIVSYFQNDQKFYSLFQNVQVVVRGVDHVDQGGVLVQDSQWIVELNGGTVMSLAEPFNLRFIHAGMDM